jgi:hypothetical protein
MTQLYSCIIIAYYLVMAWPILGLADWAVVPTYAPRGTKVFFTGRKKISVSDDKYEISEISEISDQI